MKIEDLIGPDHVAIDFRGGDKTHVLGELAQRAAAASGIDAHIILKALKAREQLGSTGVGQGVAIPHARINGLTRYFALFARLPVAIDFAAIDSKPVDLIFLLLMPENTGSDHLAALAAISRKLRDKTLAPRLRSADEAIAIYELLTRNET